MDNYRQIKEETYANGATLVAVSKTYPVESILEIYKLGQRDFGENKVQELVAKAEQMPDDIRWHQIGHLQTNKVKQLLPYVHLIHTLDSIKLAREICKQAQEADINEINCLIQVKIAEEDTKYGIPPEDVADFLEGISNLPEKSIRLCGLMGMASNTDDPEKVYKEFVYLRELYDTLKATYFQDTPYFNTLSMGMSSDYRQAISAGTTMVRIGSLIFGKRK